MHGTKRIGIKWITAASASLCVGVSVASLVLAHVEPPAEEVRLKPSSYALAADLETQLTYLAERIEGDLEDPSKFDRRAKRVERDANTIAVLALVMGNHDQKNRLQGASAAVVDAAQSLAGKTADHAAAKSAYAALAQCLRAPRTNGPEPWRLVGSIESHMLQVPQLDTSLKSSIKPSRFEVSRQKAAATAATIAAIAQISMFDQTYCKDQRDHEEWVELCVCMRDAASEVCQAIHGGDIGQVEKAMRPLSRTCDDCHDTFRD